MPSISKASSIDIKSNISDALLEEGDLESTILPRTCRDHQRRRADGRWEVWRGGDRGVGSKRTQHKWIKYRSRWKELSIDSFTAEILTRLVLSCSTLVLASYTVYQLLIKYRGPDTATHEVFGCGGIT